MTGRPRGRPRGRPKGSGRGRGRGRASQTEGPFQRRESRSPPLAPPCKSAGGGGLHMISSAHGLPLSPHPGAPPPGAYPYTPPSQTLQPPGLPHPPPQIQGCGAMPRVSSHGKSRHPDEQSLATVSSGTQATWHGLQFSGSGRHSQDSPSSRQSSGSRQAVEAAYSRQSLDHQPFGDFRGHGTDHQERPSARKSHRQPRDFPFLQEFEPAYNGQKEKRFSSSSSSSSSGQRHDKEPAGYGSQRLGGSSEKALPSKYQVKDVSQRIQFENMEPTYQKQKSYCDTRHDRDLQYANRRSERDPSYDCQRQERDQRCSGLRRDRDSFQTSSRRERDVSYGVQRVDLTRRSSSADSNHSYESQCTDRDTSPHFSPSPSTGYHPPETQPYGRESRSHSVEREAEFTKHRESSGDRYAPPPPPPPPPLPPPTAVQFSAPANFPRQAAGGFPEPASRHAERDAMFSASSVYGMEPHLQTKNGCSGKAGKSSKSSGWSSGRGSSSVPGQFGQRVASYPDLLGHEARVDGRPVTDSSWKKTAELQETHARNASSERSVCGPSDRERSSSSSRKKQTSSSSRDPSADVYLPPLLHYSQQGSYLPPSPYSSSGCAAASIPSSASAAPASSSAQRGQYKTNFSSCEEEYSSFRVPRQQASFTPLPQERDRPSRPARSSPPSSPPSQSPYPSRPPTPPLYSPRPASPAPFPPHPPRSGSPGRQQFHKAEERPGARRSSRLAEGGSNPVGCQGAVEKKNAQTSPGLPAPQRAQRRSSRGDESPESEELPPPAEPMAWQQQYLKHLQQQQQQQQQEEQTLGEMLQQEEQMHQEHAKQQVHMGREQLQREQVKKTHELVQREIQQEQMRKQQEQMHREYIKIQQEKMQREHLQLLEQLQREHMIQLEQMRNEHMKQQQEQMQREHLKQQDHGQRDNFKQRQERLLREQLKQQDKLRREHLKQQEHMQREHTKLQQEYLQCERLKFQEQMRCEQQERTQREFVHQELMQKHKLQQQQQHRSPEDDEHVQMYPRQLPDCIQQRYEQIQKQQQQELRLQHHEQFNPAQEHQQPQYHSDHREYQQRFQQQQQQQPNTSQEQRPHQQQYPQQPPQNPNESGQQQYHQQQQLRQQQPQIMQCPQQQQGQLSHQPQQHNSCEHAPVPPWRQGSNGGESRGYIPHPVDSSPARHEAQTASPARHPPLQNISSARQPHQGFPPASVPHQSISLTTQPHQSVVSFAPATQPHQLRPSPVGQMSMPHNGSHTLVTANSGSYVVPGSEQSMAPPAAQPNGAMQPLPGLQAQYQSQHHSGQIMVQSQQTFEAHGPPPTGSSSDQQGPKPKKPPWLQDQEAQVMCTQKKPPWQQQPEHVIIVAGQEAVVGGGASQFPVEAGSAATGQQFPVQPQTVGMSGPPTLRRMAVNSLQDQGQLRHPSNVDPLAGGGGVPHQQTLVSAHSQQNPHHHGSYDSSGHAYSNGLQTRPRVTQAQIHGTVLSGAVVSSGGHHYSQHSADPQRLPSSALTVSGHNNPANVHVVFSHAAAATNPPRSRVYLHQASENSNNEGMYPYQTPSGFPAASAHGGSSTTDQECAQQVLVEALNEQVQQSGLHASNTGHGVVMSQGVQIVDPNNAGVPMHSLDACLVSSLDAQRPQARNPPGLETYTLHHLFDDSNRMQPHAQVLPPHSREGQFHPHQQGPHQQLAMEQDHQVVPGNPLDTAVAMLNFPDSALDIPMIEQHQVFVLEPPGTGAHNRQPSAALASSSDVPAARRNSWHTPEHSVAGSRPGSFADDDAELVIDLSTELCEEDDDDIFSSQEPAPTSTAAASKAPPQESVSFTNTGINDLGLRISSVFSLATTRRKKRRTMSDSVLQEVELVERQQGLFDGGLGDSLVVTKGNNRQRHPSTTSSQTQNSAAAAADSGLDFAFPQDQKGVCALDGVYGFNSSAQDPLAELTKLLFAGDMSAPSPGTSTAEDWNLQEAAGVSFEADSVCVPGTPARGEPERLTTPLPQLFTPMPQMGTPMPLCYKDPGTPFQRHVPVSQYIKNPATPLPACAKETKEQQSMPLPATPFAAYHSTDVKEPMASLPHPVREVKKASLPTSSCAMGPPPLLPGFAVKAKDPSVPLPQCAKGSTASLTPCRQEPSVASHNSASGTTRQQSVETVLEIGVEPLEKIISKKVERASRQPLEQAIRELLGDEPIEKVTEKSFRDRTGKSPRRDRVKVPAQQPQRKSERISAKETMTTCSDVQVEKTSEPPVSEKDVRSRVKDNWERRCISKITSTPKSITSRSRDSSRESDPGRRCVQIIPEPTAGGGCHRNKTPPRTRMTAKAEDEEEEEKKSCGVRGRRTMTMAGKRRHVSGTHSSVEDSSPDRRGLHQVTDGSHKPWLQSMRSLSQDSSDGEGDTKPPCNKDSIKREAEAHPAEDVDQDAFFPSLSRTNSTDSSSSIEDSGNAGERDKRRRLSSCESRVSRRSSQCSCEEEVGENIADMILPTVFPPSRRRRRNDVAKTAGSTDLLATFHEHKLRCLEMEGEHYVVLEEVLAKCFPGLPRAQVERARLRDLNLLTRTVHLLGSGLPGGDSGEAVSVMALPDAARLLHFFHGMLPCPGTDCRLRRSSPDDRQGSQPSDSSRLQKHNADEVLKTGVPRSGSLGFKCTDSSNAVDGKTVRAVGGRARAESSGDDGVEEAVAESDSHEDTRSCHSDQTLPYCDGQPLMAWEEESVTKSGNNSDGERAASPSILSYAVGGRKFRRHSSDSEGRVRQLRDKEGLHRAHLSKSPDNVSLGGTSPMLPPLLTYVTSPFTPGSMYNVPMDNERVLLECFSAPGSQAPSSVRSAPSVRLLSPDRADPAHFDEDVFEGLSSHKFLSEFESVNANTEPPSKQLASSLLNGKTVEEDKPEDCLAVHSVDCGVRSRTESVDFHDLHCTVDFDVEESDDVFLEEYAQFEEGRHHSKPSDYRLKDVEAGLEKGCFMNESSGADKGNKDTLGQLFEKTLQCQRNEVYTTLPLTADLTFPSSVAEKQQFPKKDSNSVNNKLMPSRDRETERQLARHLDEKLSALVAGQNEAERSDRDQIQNNNDSLKCASSGKTAKDVAEKESLDDRYDRVSVEGSARSSVSASLSELDPVSLHPSSEMTKLSTEAPSLAIERKSSDATIAYGASDEEADVNSNTEKPNQAWLGSQDSTGPPQLSTVRGSVQTNTSPHTSPPRIDPITSDKALDQPHEAGESSRRLLREEEEPQDERRPPEASDGTLEDRVQDFIAHGKQFTPRAVVRSNSLPDLCGAESLPSPVRASEEESKYYTPGSVTHRSASYPGASNNSSSGSAGNISDPVSSTEGSPVPSPAAPQPTAISDPAAPEKRRETSTADPSGATASCALSPRSVKETTSAPDAKASSDQIPELDGAVFLDPPDVVDGGEVCTRATPRRSPQAAADVGPDQLFEWAVPCAAHGSVFCSCEGIDIQEVAASPRVGPWLCTPGTPAPATPFCDYSRLIYSPFPVEAGMTPARPDALTGSPKLPLTPELDAMVCGVKRVAPIEGQFTPAEGQAAAKRRPISPSLQNDGSVKSSCCDSDVIERNGGVDGHRDVGRGGGGGRDGAAGDEETDRQLLDSEELELIAAAAESERNMANLSSEEKLQLTSFPAEEGLLPLTTASDISDGCSMVDTDTARADSDSVHTALHPSEKVEINAHLHQGIKTEENAPLIQCDTLAGNAALNQCDKIESHAPLNQCDTLEGDAPLNQLDEIEDNAPLKQGDKRQESVPLNQRDKLAASAVLQLSDTRVPHHDPSQHSTTADFGGVEENPFKPTSCDTDDDKTPSPKEPRTNPSAEPITTGNNVANSDKTAMNSAHTDTLDPLAKTPIESSESCAHDVISRTTENLQTQNSQTENMEETEEMPEGKTSPLTKLLPNRTMPCDLSDTRVAPDTAMPYAISDIKPVPDSTFAYDILDTKTVSGAVSSCDMPVTKVVPDSTIPDDSFNSKRVPDITISDDVPTTTLAPDSTMSPNDDISDTKVGPDRATGAYDISDTNSVETADSESVPDVRIIALGDFDLTSLESEDSSDSTEVKLSPKVSEPDLKQPAPENKKTLTLAQYRERHKKRANSRDSTSSSDDCKAAETETGATKTPKASDSEVDGTRQEKEKTQIVDDPARDVPSPKPSTLTSRECVTSAKPRMTSGEHAPKVQRTESVPAEPSRRVAVQLKRSSSFHGHSPASKRFKHEGEENMDITKADRSRLPEPDDQEGRSPPKLTGEDNRGSSHSGSLSRARRVSAEACPGSTAPSAELRKQDGKRTEETKGKYFETKKDGAKKEKEKRDGNRNAGMSVKEREENRGEQEEEKKKKSEDSRISHSLFCVCEMTNTSDITKSSERNVRREMSEINDRTEQTEMNSRTEGTETKDRTQASETSNDRTEQTEMNDRTEGTETKDRTQASEIISDRTEQTEINERTEQSMEVDQVSQSMNDVNTEPRGCSDASELSGSDCQSMADVTERDTELAALTQHMTEQKGVTYGFVYSTCDTPVQDERWPTTSMDEKRMSIPDQDDLMADPSEGGWMITLTSDERLSAPQQDTLISASAKDVCTFPPTRDETVSTPKQGELISTSSQGVCMPTPAHGERIATSNQEDLMPTSTEDEGMPIADDDVRMSSPTQDESLLALIQDARVENPTQDGRVPIPGQEERIPTTAKYARMSTPIQDESMSTPTPDETMVTPTPDENMPVPTHDRNVPPPRKDETVSAPTPERNTSTSTQDDSMSTLRQNDRMPTLTQHQGVSSPTQPKPVSSPSQHERMSSPAQLHRMTSPTQHQRMSSPTQHQPVSSPTQHERMSSPTQHQPISFPTQHERMPSPIQQQRMSSPAQHQRMLSPTQHERMPSPIQHERMPSPIQHERMSFPTQLHRMSSPIQHHRMSSPTQHERLPSPSQHERLSSPTQHERLSSPTQHERLPSSSQHERLSSPTQYERMPSPTQHERLSSPTQHERMSSPTQHQSVSSPSQHHRMSSPTQRERISSPIQQQPMSFPTQHEGLSYPTQHERMPSPIHHQPVSSPTQHERMSSPIQHQQVSSPTHHKRISSLAQHEIMPSSIQHERMSSPTQGNGCQSQKKMNQCQLRLKRQERHRQLSTSECQVSIHSNKRQTLPKSTEYRHQPRTGECCLQTWTNGCLSERRTNRSPGRPPRH